MKKVGFVFHAFGFVVFLLLGCTDQGDPLSAVSEEGSASVSFGAEVLPIFQSNCVGCHGGASPTAGLNLTGYSELMSSTSEHSPVVVAGDPDESYLVKKLEGTEQPQMPPPGPLPTSQIETIRQWIEEGAEEN